MQGVFHLPVLPRYVLSDWFVNSLNDIIRDGEDRFVVNDESHWQCVLSFIVNPTLSTPRAVVRLIDTLRTTWPSARGEVDLADFVGLQAIRLFRKTTYATIRKHERWLTGDLSAGELMADGEDDRARNTFESIVAECGEMDPARREAEEMLAALFPHAEERVGDSFRFTQEAAPASGKRLRLCEPARFPVYFGQPPGEMTLSRMDLLNAVKNPFESLDLDALIDRCTASERRGGGSMGPVFIDELSSVLEEVDRETWPSLLATLPKRGDELVTRTDRERAGIGRSPVRTLSRLIGVSMAKVERDERIALLEQSVATCRSPATITHLLGMIHHRQNTDDAEETETAGREPALEGPALHSLLGTLHERLLEKLDAGELDALPDPRILFVMWHDFAGDGRLAERLSELEKTAAGRKRLAALLVGPGGSSGDGPFDLVPDWTDDPLDIQALAAEIEQDIERTAASDAEPILMNFLKAAKRRRPWG